MSTFEKELIQLLEQSVWHHWWDYSGINGYRCCFCHTSIYGSVKPKGKDHHTKDCKFLKVLEKVEEKKND